MSILPLSIFAKTAISFMKIPIVVQDVVYQRVSGQDQQGTPITRTIYAAVDAQSGKRLEQIFGGAVTDASIGIYTDAPLYFLDAFQSNEVRKQSYVSYAGTQYRVIQNADWTAQAGVYVYLANRHLPQEGI